MSYFAKIDNSIVTDVIKAEQDFINTLEGVWLQTSYNTRGNVHLGPDMEPDGGIAFRGNYARIGGTYDAVNDVFYSVQPYASWILNQTSWLWEPPFPAPTDGMYLWNETTLSWDKVDIK